MYLFQCWNETVITHNEIWISEMKSWLVLDIVQYAFIQLDRSPNVSNHINEFEVTLIIYFLSKKGV